MSVLERSILSLLYDRRLNKAQIHEELADKAIDKINKAIKRLLTKKMISYLKNVKRGHPLNFTTKKESIEING